MTPGIVRPNHGRVDDDNFALAALSGNGLLKITPVKRPRKPPEREVAVADKCLYWSKHGLLTKDGLCVD
jgi:hypothetical protein